MDFRLLLEKPFLFNLPVWWLLSLYSKTWFLASIIDTVSFALCSADIPLGLISTLKGYLQRHNVVPKDLTKSRYLTVVKWERALTLTQHQHSDTQGKSRVSAKVAYCSFRDLKLYSFSKWTEFLTGGTETNNELLRLKGASNGHILIEAASFSVLYHWLSFLTRLLMLANHLFEDSVDCDSSLQMGLLWLCLCEKERGCTMSGSLANSSFFTQPPHVVLWAR